jgi:hypothetical protein
MWRTLDLNSSKTTPCAESTTKIHTENIPKATEEKCLDTIGHQWNEH